MKNIYFSKLFVICIGIMILNKSIGYFNDYEELFRYGDSIYHILVNIVSILTRLATGVAGAIIFYYCIEFVNISKEIDRYGDLRRNLLFLLYGSLEALKNVEGFNSFKDRNCKPGDFFNIYDIPELKKIIDTIPEKTLKSNIINYLNSLDDKKIGEKIKVSEYEIECLKNKKKGRFIKNSSDYINSIIVDSEEDINWKIETLKTIKDNPEYYEINKKNLIEQISEGYIIFLNEVIDFYLHLECFIDSIQKRKIWTFIKLVD